MRTLFYSAVFSAAAITATQPASAQLFGGKPKIEATYIIVSKSNGLYVQEEKPIVDAAFVHVTRQEINETRSGRNKERRIQIIMPTEATNAVFAGSGQELERDGGRVFQRITGFEARCNDLTRSYANVRRDLEIHGYESIRIVHIGPFVNVPAPCEDAGPIHVPQTVSQDVELAAIFSNAKRVEFTAMMVHRDQYAPLWDYLSANGVSEIEDHSIEILRPDETRTPINFIEDGSVISAGEAE